MALIHSLSAIYLDFSILIIEKHPHSFIRSPIMPYILYDFQD